MESLLLAASGHTERAIERIDEYLAERPNQVAPLIWRARWLLELGDVQHALGAFERAEEIESTVAGTVGLIQSDLAASEWQKVVDRLDSLNGLDRVYVAEEAAVAYRSLGMPDEARRWQGIVIPHGHPPMDDITADIRNKFEVSLPAKVSKLRELMAQGDSVLAEARELHLKHSGYRSATALYLEALARAGEKETRTQTLIEATERDPAYFLYPQLLALDALNDGEFETASRHVAKLLSIDDANYVGHLIGSRVELAQAGPAAAYLVMQEAVSKHPEVPEILLEAAGQATELGKFADARELLMAATRIQSNTDHVMQIQEHLVLVHSMLGDRELAQEALRTVKMLGLSPERTANLDKLFE